jgi:ParB family chromosome partitioning protein
MAVQKQRRLGRGLSSLIQGGAPAQVESPPPPTPGETPSPVSSSDNSIGSTGALVRMIAVGEVDPSSFQPRRAFDEGSLVRLAASISRAGLMQPIIVRPGPGGRYELVAGERRWRAAKLAGLGVVPAVVRELADGDAAEWALIENIQREDLNPIERAHGLASLGARFGLSHAQLGERVGLERSTVANLIRLTELEEELQAMVSAGALQMGHARALLGMPGGAARLALAKRASDGLWSVRQVEAAVRGSIVGDSNQNPAQSAHATPTQREAVIADIERRLCEHLGTRVRITLRASGTKGRMQVEFYSLEQFEGLMERIGLSDDGAL